MVVAEPLLQQVPITETHRNHPREPTVLTAAADAGEPLHLPGRATVVTRVPKASTILIRKDEVVSKAEAAHRHKPTVAVAVVNRLPVAVPVEPR